MRLSALLALVSVFHAGCTVGEVGIRARGDGLSQGAIDDGDPAVVNVANCSAVLVAPRVLLTAAHCVDGADPAGLEAFFGNDRNGPGNRTPIIDARLHPGWDAVTLAHDAALLL